jgi:hypothetical protein
MVYSFRSLATEEEEGFGNTSRGFSYSLLPGGGGLGRGDLNS